jgi:hypothetical protein
MSRVFATLLCAIAVLALSTEVRSQFPQPPNVRSLTSGEITFARQVYSNSVNYSMVRVTDTLGLNDRPWTSNTPPLWTMNVGSAYANLNTTARRRLFIHELAHVWQGQHAVPFMIGSAAHQGLAAILNGGSVAPAYTYTLPGSWAGYNPEQQANIVSDWFSAGMSTSDHRYPFIRDHIRAGKPF